MMKNTKKSKVIQKELEGKDIFKFDEALSITKKFASKKFDENLDISVVLGIDAKKSDQQIRGVISLPKMPKKDVKVAVFADGDDIKKAQDAGADIVGAEELIDKVKQGELNFDKCISTPKMMVKVSSLGQILGPKGLMPNPKLGTVTNDIKEGVKNIKSGQIEFKTDKAGIVHVPIGKVSFTDDEIKKNLLFFMDELKKRKPENSKGVFIKKFFINSTMGPGLQVDSTSVM
jgi:large subunit ribosomal protein L1